MNKDKSSAQTHIPGKGLLCPLSVDLLLHHRLRRHVARVVSLCVVPEWAGLLAFLSPMSYMVTIFVGQIFGPTLAAFLMTSVTEGNAALRRFMRRIVEWRVGIRFNYEIKI